MIFLFCDVTKDPLGKRWQVILFLSDKSDPSSLNFLK